MLGQNANWLWGLLVAALTGGVDGGVAVSVGTRDDVRATNRRGGSLESRSVGSAVFPFSVLALSRRFWSACALSPRRILSVGDCVRP